MIPANLSATDQAAFNAGNYNQMSLQGLQAVEAQMRPLVASSTPSPALSSTPATSPQAGPNPLSTGQMIGPVLGHAAQGLLQGIADVGQDAGTWMDRGVNKLLGTHLSAPQGNVFALDPTAANSTAAKVGNTLGQGAALMMAAPEVGPEMLGNGLLRFGANVGAQGAAGAALAPNSPKLGASVSSATYAASKPIGMAVKFASDLLPDEFAQHIKNVLTGGASVDKNAENIASQIRANYQNVKGVANQNYQNLFNAAGESGAQQGERFSAPLLSQALQDPELSKIVSKNLTPDEQQFLIPRASANATPALPVTSSITQPENLPVGTTKVGNMLYTKTVASNGLPMVSARSAVPGVVNEIGARTISQLNPQDLSADLNKVNTGRSILQQRANEMLMSPDTVDKVQGRQLKGVADALSTDFANHLQNLDPTGGLTQQFSNANEYYKTQVLPYFSSKPLKSVALGQSGRLENPSKVFSRPDVPTSTEMNPQGQPITVTRPSVATIAEQGGDQLKNGLIADALKNSYSTNGSVNGEKMINAYNGLEKQGLSSYITPATHALMSQLADKTNTQLLQRAPMLFGRFFRTGLIRQPIENVLMKPLQRTGSLLQPAVPVATKLGQAAAIQGVNE